MTTPDPNQLYTLLDAIYTHQELCVLCIDNEPFRPAYDRLESAEKETFIRGLIDHTIAIDQLQELLLLTKAHNPTLYGQHQPTWDTADQPSPQRDDYPITINRQEIINQFRQLLAPYPPYRLLCLAGEAKMGKSHLMKKVFPRLARPTPFALVELGPYIDCAATMQTLAAQLNPDNFPAFNQAYLKYLDRPVIQADTFAGVAAQVSSRTTHAGTAPDPFDQYLAAQFAADLRRLAPRPHLLLFDTLDQAPPTLHTWLINTVLGQLAPLSHIRLVIAGREVPPPPAPFTDPHRAYRLTPVEDEQEYIAYCRRLQATLVEQSIRDFAAGTRYTPGLFAELVFNYIGGGGTR